MKYIFQVVDFVESAGASKNFYGYEKDSTIPSLLIKYLPTESKRCMPLTGYPAGDHQNTLAFILKVLCKGLREVYGFKIIEVSLYSITFVCT